MAPPPSPNNELLAYKVAHFIRSSPRMLLELTLIAGFAAAQSSCTPVVNACNNVGSTGGKNNWCVDDVTLNRTTPSYDGLGAYGTSKTAANTLDRATILACANSKYVARTFTPACDSVFQTCVAASNGNNYWALKLCFKNVVMGFRNVGGLPTPDPAVLAQCQADEPIPEVVGGCNKVAIKCRNNLGVSGSAIERCINEVTLNVTNQDYYYFGPYSFTKDILRTMDPAIILSCANSRYVARTFTPACESVFQSCVGVSFGNKYWASDVCFKHVLMGYQNIGGLADPNPVDLAECQAQGPIPEVVGACNKIAIKCRNYLATTGSPIERCINEVTLNVTNQDYYYAGPYTFSKTITNTTDTDIILSCANSRYVARNFTSACESVFQSCVSASFGNKYWASDVCFKHVVMGYQNVGFLPSPEPSTLAECQVQNPIPEIKGGCNKLAAGCRSIGYITNTLRGRCQDYALKGLSTFGRKIIPVNESYIEECRLANPKAGICKTACDRVNIFCRKAGLSGTNDELLFAFCNLPVIQGNATVPGTDSPLPVVDAAIIQNCKDETLAKATSVKPQPYYYDIGYQMFLMQNMTLAQYDEVNKLMIASKASVTSYDNFTAQQIYDLEVAENIRWRALSQNFTIALTASSDDMDPASLTPLATRVANLKALQLKLYGYWREIFMLAFIKRWRQYSFTPAAIARLSILSVANSGNATTRTNLLNKHIAKISKDLGLLQVLTRDLNTTENLNSTQDLQLIKDYTDELEADIASLIDYRDSFNSTFWDDDRVTTIEQKLKPVRSLLDLWEFRMFKLVSMKKNIVNAVDALYQTLAGLI